ncbi:hypothetical protein RHS01_05267 [Rhizoctonia solani]|uniref:Uncharacterized protein n=1 Tax=Rhizoctonia solani TaxID=456999 RepID=A0A8H7IBS4_9AGAM|nr:hypothetical protein RHS01_05267 [Rhizoctonia solani]
MGAYASDVRQHDNGGENLSWIVEEDCRARRVRVGVRWALDKDGTNTAARAIALSDWDAMTNDGRVCGAEEMTTASAAGSVGRREKARTCILASTDGDWTEPTGPPRGDYRPPPPGSNGGAGATSGQRGHQTMWRRAQEEARYVIKIEQDRLDRLFAAEAETLKQAEEALSHRRSRRSSEDPEYAERCLRRGAKGTAGTESTRDRSHPCGHDRGRARRTLDTEESQWLENNIQKRKAEEERQSMKRAQEEEAERLRKLEEEEAAAKLRAAQAEELAQAARLERFALPPIPDPEELSLALYSDPSSVDTATPDDDKALARLSANPLPRPPKETYPTNTAGAARRAWANNLKSEWDRRGAHEEQHTHLHPDPPSARRHPPQRSPSFSYRYQPASPEAIAAARRAEEIRRYQEHQEEIKYREQQAARAAREAREAAAARKAFERSAGVWKRNAGNRPTREEERGADCHCRLGSLRVWLAGPHQRCQCQRPTGLTFYDIPWPVSMPARSFEELQSSAIEKFLLSPCHSPTKTRKMRLRAALMQWHPDKFAQRFVDRIEESHRTAILTAVNSVARTITELMTKEGES